MLPKYHARAGANFAELLARPPRADALAGGVSRQPVPRYGLGTLNPGAPLQRSHRDVSCGMEGKKIAMADKRDKDGVSYRDIDVVSF